jgi:hypothetical protein
MTDLLSWRPPSPWPIDGATYVPELDEERLGKQMFAVWNVVKSGAWYYPTELESLTGYNWSSINARLRDFRKPKFGGFTVQRQRVQGGLFRYRLVPERKIPCATSSFSGSAS